MFWNSEVSVSSEPAKVLLKRGEFVDASRHNPDGSVRSVPFKLYHPVDHDFGKMPVIIWSHGFGGNRDGASFISRYVAAHGYVIVHLTHYGTDSSLWEGKPAHPWDILRKTKVPRETTMNRFLDVPFALGALQEWAQGNPEVGQYMDFDTLGISGHSFGAMTTQVMAGMRFPDAQGNLVTMPEPRFQAGILYSPVPIPHLTDAPEGELYGPISIPLLHMTGTDDDSPIEGFGYEHRLVVYENTEHAEKYLLIKQDGDHMVYNGTRGKLGDNPKRLRHEEIVKVASLAFWDAQLKGDEDAQSWLTGGGFVRYLADDGEFRFTL